MIGARASGLSTGLKREVVDGLVVPPATIDLPGAFKTLGRCWLGAKQEISLDQTLARVSHSLLDHRL